MTELGDLIKQARIDDRLSQEELGLRIGESQEFVSRWERGDVDADIPKAAPLANLSRELGIPVVDLLQAAGYLHDAADSLFQEGRLRMDLWEIRRDLIALGAQLAEVVQRIDKTQTGRIVNSVEELP